MAEANRIKVLKDLPPRTDGAFVQYWMQQAQRAEGNPALDHAIELANGLRLPVVVSFGLTGLASEPYPEANARHFAFLLQGLAEVETTLRRRGIAFVIRHGSPVDVTLDLARQAAILVLDHGYLRPQRDWRRQVVERAPCRVVAVETDAVVPVELASGKHEVGARTLRPKIARLWDEFLAETPSPTPKRKAAGLDLASDVDLSDPLALTASLKVDQSVRPVRRFTGGLSAARANLDAFLAVGFDGYKEKRGAPELRTVSHLSPYLHLGQISPVEIALKARAARTGGAEDRASFLDELIVRRELAFNHVWYEPAYDRYEAVPAWARASLAEQARDKRPFVYDRAALEASDTHDAHWNAAMREMRETGYLHNRMRMYWGKKILEWSKTPEQAYADTLAINNKFFICGRDANSYTNVAWVFGLHDRPWFRRPIFGIVRYMGANTLKKFDAASWLRTVDELVAAEGDHA